MAPRRVRFETWLKRQRACSSAIWAVRNIGVTRLRGILHGRYKLTRPEAVAIVSCSPKCFSCNAIYERLPMKTIRKEADSKMIGWRGWLASDLNLPENASTVRIVKALKEKGVVIKW